MTKLVYTLLPEGIAEYSFIPNYIAAIGKSYNLQFKRSSKQIKKSSSPSKSKVLNNIEKFAIDSLWVDEDDLFVVGVDLDKPDHDLTLLKKEKEKLVNKLPDSIDQDKAIIFIPIQAINYWIFYLKKNRAANSLESNNKQEIKKSLYGYSKPNEAQIRKQTEQTFKISDYKNLAKLSKSFLDFHKAFTKFCVVKKAG